MGKCIKCKKKGLFFKVNSAGLCNNCERISILENEERSYRERLDTLNASIADKGAYIASVREAAKTEALNEIAEDIGHKKDELNKFIEQVDLKKQELDNVTTELNNAQKSLNSAITKTQKAQTAYKSIQYALKKQSENANADIPVDDDLISNIDEFLSATVEQDLII